MVNKQDIPMRQHYENYISKISLGGSWASRSFTDHIFNLHFSGKLSKVKLEEINEIANHIFSVSQGYSSEIQKLRLEHSFNLNIDSIDSSDIDRYAYSPVDLNTLPSYIGNETFNPEYWKEQLLEITKTPNFNSLDEFIYPVNHDASVDCDRSFLLYNWSFPLIRTLNPDLTQHNIDDEHKTVKFITGIKRASETWKRWFINDNHIYMIDDDDHLGLPPAYWLVWKFVHDASHVYHLSYFNKPSHCTDTHWLLVSESFAMHNEYSFYKMLRREGKDILPTDFANYYSNILVVLVIGLLERTLRLHYDLDVHLNGMSRTEFKNQHSIYGNTLFRFVDEFHGLPGFSSIYSVGRLFYANNNNKADLLNGLVKLY